MDALHQLEIVVNLWVQGWGEWLKLPMQALSFMGTENFYMFIMPALFWCLDARLGLRIGVIYLLSSGLNAVLKLAFHTARPYWIDARVTAYAAESGFGLPSGHSQTAAAVWGLLAASLRKPAVKIGLVLFIFLIGLSRLFLGVHFLSDVLLGWAVGALLLFLFLTLEKAVGAWAGKVSKPVLFASVLLSSFLMVVLVLGVRASLGSWQPPVAWAEQALARSDAAIDPLNTEGAFTLGGTWLGLVGGAAWLFRCRGWYNAKGTPVQLLLRYLLGLVGVVVFWFGLKLVFPNGDDLLSHALRFLRYALIGGWVSAGAPLLFLRLGLARPAGKL